MTHLNSSNDLLPWEPYEGELIDPHFREDLNDQDFIFKTSIFMLPGDGVYRTVYPGYKFKYTSRSGKKHDVIVSGLAQNGLQVQKIDESGNPAGNPWGMNVKRINYPRKEEKEKRSFPVLKTAAAIAALAAITIVLKKDKSEDLQTNNSGSDTSINIDTLPAIDSLNSSAPMASYMDCLEEYQGDSIPEKDDILAEELLEIEPTTGPDSEENDDNTEVEENELQNEITPIVYTADAEFYESLEKKLGEKEHLSENLVQIKCTTAEAIEYEKIGQIFDDEGNRIIYSITDTYVWKQKKHNFQKKFLAFHGTSYNEEKMGKRYAENPDGTKSDFWITRSAMYMGQSSALYAFLIGKSGITYQFFDPALGKGSLGSGVKKSGLSENMTYETIAVEITSRGDYYVAYQETHDHNYGVEPPNEEQIPAARDLNKYLCKKFNIPYEHIISSKDPVRKAFEETRGIHGDDQSDYIREQIEMPSIAENKILISRLRSIEEQKNLLALLEKIEERKDSLKPSINIPSYSDYALLDLGQNESVPNYHVDSSSIALEEDLLQLEESPLQD